MFALREARWKLIFGLGSGGNTEPYSLDPEPGEAEGQLYDMGADISETNNRWLEQPALVADLTALFERYRRQGHSKESSNPVMNQV